MMNIQYFDWEPEKGLEEYQARIYNETNNPTPPITPESIIQRNKQEKPVFCRIALTEEKEPLAYVQARDYPAIKETHIGFPWALTNCPKGVQDRLFDEMVTYVKNRKESMTIRANAASERKEILEFFKKKGLKEKTRSYRYDIELKKLNEAKFEGYTTQLATLDDIDKLVELIREDGRFDGQFPTDEDVKTYFTDRVFATGHCILVYKDDNLVMASAPLIYKLPPENKDTLILRFHSYRKGSEGAYRPLLVEMAKECLKANYGTQFPISTFVSPSSEEIFATILDDFDPVKTVTGFSFGFEE